MPPERALLLQETGDGGHEGRAGASAGGLLLLAVKRGGQAVWFFEELGGPHPVRRSPMS